MSTSLAEQLQKLAKPQTTLLTRDKKKPSLLFDAKEAATLRFEDVYQIGVDGLEELISKNPVFEQFRNVLFDADSKTLQRAVESKEFNKNLNSLIKKFLTFLSPYFLLNCSHKALEWLVHRFYIHEYNREDILCLILPYHETNIFIRMLQLLVIKDSNDNFFFLKPLQKPGLHLPKQSLLNHAASNPYFLEFTSNYVLSIIKLKEKSTNFTVAFNHYCSVFCGALEYSKEVTEAHLSSMLPALSKGLKSSNLDFRAATFVIIARLVSKTELSSKLLDVFVGKIAEYFETRQTTPEAIALLLIIYQKQEKYSIFPSGALQKMAKQEHFPVILQAMSNSGDYIDPLLEVVFRAVIVETLQTNDDCYKEFMKNVLNKMKFDHQFVDALLSLILEIINKNYPFKKVCQSWLRQVIEILETQYPEQFNKSVNSVLLGCDLKKKSCLKKLFRQSMLMDSKFKLFEKLHNPNPHIRNEALQLVSSDFKRLNETDKVMIKDFLIDRLYDDDPQVVESALNSLASIPDVDKIQLKNSLRDLCLKYERKKIHKTTSMKILQHLVNNPETSEHEIVTVLLPYFVSDPGLHKPKDVKKLMNCLKTIKSSFIQINRFESNLSPKKLYETFISMLNNNSDSSLILELVKVINVETEDIDVFYIFLILLVLSNLTPESVNEKDGLIIIDTFREIMKRCKFHDKKLKITGAPCEFNNVCKYLDKARTGNLYVEFYLQCLSKIFSKVNISTCDNLGVVDLQSDEKLKLFVNIADIFIHYFDHYKEYTYNLLKKICKTTVNQCEFLLNFLLLDTSGVENCLKIILSLLLSSSDGNEIYKTLMSFDSVGVPYLLILLSNEKECVRKGALNVLETLVNESEQINDAEEAGPYLVFMKELLKNKEEILLDHEEMPLLMFSALCTNKKKNNFSGVLSEFLKLISSDKNPIYLRAGLVNLLSLINTIDIFECTSRLANETLNPGCNELNAWQNLIILKNIQQIETSIAGKINFDSNVWKFIETALQDDQTLILYGEEKFYVSVLTMKQITRDLFASLNVDIKLKLLDLVIDLTIITENAMILPEANRLFANIEIDASLIQDHLVKMRDVQSTKEDPNQSKRKRRIARRISTIIPTIDILDTFDWRKGVAVLEFTQGKYITDDNNVLLPLFFGNLKKCLDFDEQVSVEYPKQLLLSAMYQMCLKFKGDRSITANLFNVELIVQCIRVSQNPQTHHHALLLLTKLSELIPQEVLQHIIPIFTFVGSSVLRYDDAYSFHILVRVINEVIPILVAEKTTIKIADVLRVFVYAIVDVPEYRRKPLYKQLLSNIGVEKNLYLFLLLVFESTVSNNTNTNTAGQKNHKVAEKKRCQIAADLCREFHPKIVINNCIRLLEYLCSLPDDLTYNSEMSNDVINISHFRPEQFHHYKYILIDFIKDLITSKEFIFQVAELSDDELSAMVNLNANMVVNILTYVQRVTKVIDRSDHSVRKRYWEKIQEQSFQVLNGIYALLTCEMFLRVTQGLMVYRLGKVQKQALELLNYKLEHSQEFFSQCSVEDFEPLINQLIETVKKCQIISSDDVEQERIIQISLNSLILIVKLLGSKYPEHFKTPMEIIISLLKSNMKKREILASLILCSAELFANLRSHAIPHLSSYMRDILKMLKKERKQDADPLLLLPLLTAINKILQVFPQFLSPYLPKILTSISLLSSMYCISENHMLLKLESIKQIIGTQIPLRVLVPSVEESYGSLLTNSCYKSIGSLMDILKESLKVNKPDVMLSQLTKFFLEVFQFRTNSTCSFSEATAVEEHIVQAFVTLILKLSESKFKPLYNSLYKWATEEVNSNRIVTFYNVTKNISDNLKGLFVLFASVFINNAAEVLEGCNVKGDELCSNDDEEGNIFLLHNILKSLHNVFSYDNHRFVNKDKFNILMQPLVDQLENTLGGIKSLQQRSTELLIPCIVSFCVAIADDSLWKQLNYKVLLKMRHSSPEMRLLALECLTGIIKRLGEEFLPLLPETIPFLAELLEDENETVEKACQKSVQEMEKALGESLQKYF